MPEPGTAIAGITKALTAIKDFPLWLLTGITLSLITFLSVPELSAAVPQEARPWLTLGAVAAAILTACRLGSLVISHINSYRAKMAARRTFHLTPISHRSFWSAIRQKDGTIVSQIRAEFMAKNRTNKSLRLLTARVVKPNIPGDVLDVSIHTDVDSQYGGIDYLPQGTTIRLSVVIHIRGFPGRVLKNPPTSRLC
jgi:hypothetical protein